MPRLICRIADASLARAACRAAVLCIGLGGATAAGPVREGLTDFQQGQFSEAFQAWRAADRAGDARGALYTGVLYDSGLGVRQNYARAMSWYRRAAELGSGAGSFNVGVMYDAGLGVPKDPSQAARWYGRASAQGFGRAEYNLALLYETGSGVARNRARAVTLYQRAAQHGISAARDHLARLHATAPQAPHDPRAEPAPADFPPSDPMQEFRRAQQLLLSRGAAESAHMVALFRPAAERHNPLAEYNLGYCYDAGIGVPRDQAQAYAWYKRAVADAHEDSLRSLAQSGADSVRPGAH